MTNEIVVTNTDTGTPGASDNTMPATAEEFEEALARTGDPRMPKG